MRARIIADFSALPESAVSAQSLLSFHAEWQNACPDDLACAIPGITRHCVSAQSRPPISSAMTLSFPLPVADLHSHVIADDLTRYPLAPMGGKQSDWSRERPVNDAGMVAAAAKAGVAKSVLVQASTCYGNDNRYVQASVQAHPERFVGVFSVDMQALDAIEKIQYWMRAGLSGARVFIAGHTAADHVTRLDDPRAFAAWEYIEGRSIPICVQLRADGLPQLAAVLARFPKARVLLDHFARPALEDGPSYRNAAGLFALAQFENLYFKYTTHNVRDSKLGNATQASFIRAAVDAFGAQRIGWGSNFPAAAGTLGELLQQAMDATAALSAEERGWIFSRTAQALYPALRAPLRSGASATEIAQ